jgi:hypothetical protein
VDEVDDALEDFAVQEETSRIASRRKEQQEEDLKSASSAPDQVAASAGQSVDSSLQRWSQLHDTQLQLWRAKQMRRMPLTLTEKHNALETKLEAEKEKSSISLIMPRS